MYKPLWLSLADALAYVVATGLSEPEAQSEICRAIADRALELRVLIPRNDLYFGGKTLWLSRGQVDPPTQIAPDQLDWQASRPRDGWRTGAVGLAAYGVMGQNWCLRPIAHLELYAEDLRQHWSLDEPVAATDRHCAKPESPRPVEVAPRGLTAGGAPPQDQPAVKKATGPEVHKLIDEIYNFAASQGMKPPNAKEMGGHVSKLLALKGISVSANHAEDLANMQQYKSRRLRSGETTRGRFLAFSLESFEKAGAES